MFETWKQTTATLDKQDKDDADYLNSCLARTSKKLGLMSPDLWYTSGDTMQTVARILCHHGYLITAEDAIRFFDKPWGYEEDIKELVDSLTS